MAYKIHLEPANVWEYFRRHKERLEEEMVEIAENDDTGVAIYLTEDDDLPQYVVFKNDKEQYREMCVNGSDAEQTLKKIFMQYLVPLVIPVDDDDVPVDENAMRSDFEDQIDEREDVILDAFQDFIEVLTEDKIGALDFGKDGEELDKIINHIVQYLAVDCGFRIRRPMILYDEDLKKEVCSEYPYEEYDFSEDEVNGNK